MGEWEWFEEIKKSQGIVTQKASSWIGHIFQASGWERPTMGYCRPKKLAKARKFPIQPRITMKPGRKRESFLIWNCLCSHSVPFNFTFSNFILCYLLSLTLFHRRVFKTLLVVRISYWLWRLLFPLHLPGSVGFNEAYHPYFIYVYSIMPYVCSKSRSMRAK